MSAYITEQQVEDEFSEPRLRAALDDDGDGLTDAGLLDRALYRGRFLAVDGFLEGRYIVPLSPVPALAQEATLIFTCEKIYERRRQGPDEKNPYRDRADELRKVLKAVGDGTQSIDAALKPAFTPGAAILGGTRINTSTT